MGSALQTKPIPQECPHYNTESTRPSPKALPILPSILRNLCAGAITLSLNIARRFIPQPNQIPYQNPPDNGSQSLFPSLLDCQLKPTNPFNPCGSFLYGRNMNPNHIFHLSQYLTHRPTSHPAQSHSPFPSNLHPHLPRAHDPSSPDYSLSPCSPLFGPPHSSYWSVPYRYRLPRSLTLLCYGTIGFAITRLMLNLSPLHGS